MFQHFFHQRTPLHTAARGGHECTIKYLVEKGALIDVKDKDGVIAYMRLLSDFEFELVTYSTTKKGPRIYGWNFYMNSFVALA